MERTKSRTFVKQLLLFRKEILKLGVSSRGVLTESFVFSLLSMPFVFWLPVPLARKRQLLTAGAVQQPADCQNPLAAAFTLPLWLRHCCPHHANLQPDFWSALVGLSLFLLAKVCGLGFCLVCVCFLMSCSVSCPACGSLT